MRKININKDDINGALDRLWEMCEIEDCYFKAIPTKGLIEVYRMDGNNACQIAEVNALSITDSYDIESAILKS